VFFGGSADDNNITLKKKYLKAKEEELCKLNISPCKNIIFKKIRLKKKPKILQDIIITLL
jgi:hypothetical protein